MWRKLAAGVLSALCLLSITIPTFAHFSEGAKLRTIIVANEEGMLKAYIRTPLPLLFSDIVVQAQASEVSLNTPFLYLERTGAGLRYRLSLPAIAANGDAFKERLENALLWRQDGHNIPPHLISYHISGRQPAGAFTTPEEAQLALSSRDIDLDPVFGEAYIDMELNLIADKSSGSLEVQSGYPPLPLGPGVSIDNHIVDARGTDPVAYTLPGQLEQSAVIDGSLLRTLGTFIWQGMVHILEGIDHVFLVICLALGMGGSWKRLVGLVTAFTIGHSTTLIATFLGAVPQWSWFIPAVEAAIAASVLYASVAAVTRKIGSVWIIGAVGLLHGLGFSFVLGEILGRDAPDLVPALLAFNIGIELGQIVILTATLAVVQTFSMVSRKVVQSARITALGLIGLVSAYWIVERSLALMPA